METVVKDEEEEGGLGGQMKKQIPFEWVQGLLVRRRATGRHTGGAAIKRDRPYFCPGPASTPAPTGQTVLVAPPRPLQPALNTPNGRARHAGLLSFEPSATPAGRMHDLHCHSPAEVLMQAKLENSS